MKKIVITDRTKALIKTSIISGVCYSVGAAIGNYAIKKLSKAIEEAADMKITFSDTDWPDWKDEDVEGTEDLD